MTDERHTDLCKCDWKEKIQEMWRRLQETIKGVRVNGRLCEPDGEGIIDINFTDPSYLDAAKQDKLTAGSHININGVTISATGATWGTIDGDITAQSDVNNLVNGRELKEHLTINGVTYGLRISTEDVGTDGYITFVIEE